MTIWPINSPFNFFETFLTAFLERFGTGAFNPPTFVEFVFQPRTVIAHLVGIVFDHF